MIVRIYYMAELERETQQEAEQDVILNPNLLQYLYTTVHQEDLEGGKITGIRVEPKKDFKTLCDLFKIDESLFDGIDDNTIILVYHNRYTNGMIFTAKSIESSYEFVFYIPLSKETVVIKTFSTPNSSFTAELVGKFIAKDLEKPKAWDKSLV